MRLSTEQGFPEWMAAGERSCGAGRWPGRDGRAEGMVQMRQGLAAYRATGAEL